MATSFETIIRYIRPALQDTDRSALLYSDEALVDQIRLTILSPTETLIVGVAENGEDEEFTADLTSKQILIISLLTAIRILSGIPDDFSYKSPVLSVSRRGQKRDLLSRLQAMLDDVLGGRFAIAVDNEFDALIQAYDRYLNTYDAACRAWNGSPS